MPFILAVIGFVIFPPLGGVVGFFIGLAMSEDNKNKKLASVPVKDQSPSQMYSPKELHAARSEWFDDDDNYSSSSYGYSSRTDNMGECVHGAPRGYCNACNDDD